MPFLLMDNSRLKEIDFVDLYISSSSFEITIGNTRKTVWPELKVDIIKLRECCREKLEKNKSPEYSMRYDDVLYRVTVLNDPMDVPIYFLRKSSASILPFEKLGLRDDVVQLINTRDLSGLILIAGKMANGKTTTAASLVAHRLNLLGGVGIAIEDPIETTLHGSHGNGFCFQSEASRFNGGYKELLIRTLRTGTNIIFIGEIRDSETASEVVKASINGHLIISTIHSGSIKEAIEKLYRLCEVTTRQSLSEGLNLVIHQNLENIAKDSHSRRLIASSLIIDKPTRALISNEDFNKLDSKVLEQRQSYIWNEQD